MSQLLESDHRTFKSIHLTDEQRAVVKAITVDKRNAIVNAVAGSGKTRTALTTSIEWLSTCATTHTSAGDRVLLLAYNKRLQQDMVNQRNSSVPASLQNRIEICTIHGFGHRYFGGSGLTTDRELTRWTRTRATPTTMLPSFGLVIVDEAQDLTPVLFDFLHYVLTLQSRPQVLVLGDPFQLLYRFKGADESYILEADTKFADVAADVPFEHFRLSICFRITHEMASWINTHLNPNNLVRAKAPYSGWFDKHREHIAAWWGHGIKADPRRPPEPGSVTYHVRSAYRGGPWLDGVVDEIVDVFEEFDTDSSALLSPSIVASSVSPVRLITNRLKMVSGMPQSWYIDDSRSTEGAVSSYSVQRNKRIASTIHKFKGRERDAIALVGLDSFAENIEKNDPRNVFNMFYVGATRARKRLLIVQWSDPAYATHLTRSGALDEDDAMRPPYPVTRALEYCPYDAVLCEESATCLEAKTVARMPATPLGRDDYIVSGAYHAKRRHTLENVSLVIGNAIEVGLQLLLDDGKLEVPICEPDRDMPKDLWTFMERLRVKAPSTSEYSWAEILEVATALLTLKDRLYSRWRQVQNFAGWPVVAQSGKLDDVVCNLVHLLYVPFCCMGECTPEAGPIASQEAAEAADGIPYKEKLASLKELRREGRLLFHVCMTFDMQHNAEFVRQCSDTMIGEANMMLISERAAERLRKVKEAEKDEVAHANGCATGEGVGALDDLNDVTLIQVSASSKTSHDHLLQLGCYGAMWREKRVAIAKAVAERIQAEGAAVGTDVKEELQSEGASIGTDVKGEVQAEGAAVGTDVNIAVPNMFVAYPNLGLLRHEQLHMQSFEFLHRVGYRKVNRPFNERVLDRLKQATSVTAQAKENALQIVGGPSMHRVKEVMTWLEG